MLPVMTARMLVLSSERAITILFQQKPDNRKEPHQMVLYGEAERPLWVDSRPTAARTLADRYTSQTRPSDLE